MEQKPSEAKVAVSPERAWEDRGFIESWDERTDKERSIRDMQMKTVVFMIPHPREQAIRLLDVGAGYGALAAAILADRPNASAVCLDGSEEMIKLGRERNGRFKGRVEFVRGALDAPDWSSALSGSFDAVVSARALHHLTHEQRHRFFRAAHGLLNAGGCFINADSLLAPSEGLRQQYRRTRQRWIDGPSGNTEGETHASRVRLPHGAHYNGLMEDELGWLRAAGFKDVDVFWKFTNYCVYGGFK
ncbi:MAG TPA: class I SAM-dependent methyltransferase [Candidatus Binatia bacterium]|jgi:tRNA (cmo5U34)-methyltransferase